MVPENNMPPPMNAPQGQMPPPMGAPNQAPQMAQPAQMAPQNVQAPAAPTFPQSPVQEESGSTIEEIEQVVETIIDERWKEVTENIKKVLDWKTTMEEKFVKIQEDVKNMKGDFDELYKAIVGKVGDYDKNILKVDAELQAIEKVFSQTLPAFTANVNELSRISEDLKGVHKSAKKNSEK